MLQLPVDEVVVRAIKYSSCLDVIDSDHKPVWALLALDVPVTNQEKKRRMCSHILKHTAAQGQAPASPALQLSSDTVSLSQVQSAHPSQIAMFKAVEYAMSKPLFGQGSLPTLLQPFVRTHIQTDAQQCSCPVITFASRLVLPGCLTPSDAVI
jgi:hypothetical protein